MLVSLVDAGEPVDAGSAKDQLGSSRGACTNWCKERAFEHEMTPK